MYSIKWDPHLHVPLVSYQLTIAPIGGRHVVDAALGVVHAQTGKNSRRARVVVLLADLVLKHALAELVIGRPLDGGRQMAEGRCEGAHGLVGGEGGGEEAGGRHGFLDEVRCQNPLLSLAEALPSAEWGEDRGQGGMVIGCNGCVYFGFHLGCCFMVHMWVAVRRSKKPCGTFDLTS